MTCISLIAVIDEANGLGYKNQLLCHLPADLQHFKTITMGKPIIMGRNTFVSIGKALPGRLNIVLSHTLKPLEGVLVVNSLDQALRQAHESQEIMIIGGQQLFRECINQATRLYLTKIHHQFIADVFFPEMNHALWKCTQQEFRPRDEKNKYDMTFLVYDRV